MNRYVHSAANRLKGRGDKGSGLGEMFSRAGNVNAEQHTSLTVQDLNLGEAYVDALVFACNGDWGTAWTLTPDVDYKIEIFPLMIKEAIN